MNTAPNGIIINGDNVTMYGLFVEHFQEYQTIWNGNGGRLYFYQSEMPYDAPDQKSYMSHDGKKKGYASFKIDDKVTDFEGYGLGIYCYNRDAEVEIPCEFAGDEITIAMNYKYIEEPLRVMDVERIKFEFSGEMKAVTMLPEPAEDYFHIIMPMQMA